MAINLKNMRHKVFSALPCKAAQTLLFLFALEDDSLEKHCGNLPPVEEGDRKVSLIMELSGLVSLHADRISHLEDILEEKDRKIQQLEAGQAAPPPS